MQGTREEVAHRSGAVITLGALHAFAGDMTYATASEAERVTKTV